MNNPDVMIDFETLGTDVDSTILTLGAIKFNPRTGQLGEDFYMRVDIPQTGRAISCRTIAWWMMQGNSARMEAFNETDRAPLKTMLDKFADYYAGSKCIWGNGFDVPMIEHAYKTAGERTLMPWSFRDIRCYRTLRSLTVDMGQVREVGNIPHHALDDAAHQARVVCKIYKQLGLS